MGRDGPARVVLGTPELAGTASAGSAGSAAAAAAGIDDATGSDDIVGYCVE